MLPLHISREATESGGGGDVAGRRQNIYLASPFPVGPFLEISVSRTYIYDSAFRESFRERFIKR